MTETSYFVWSKLRTLFNYKFT